MQSDRGAVKRYGVGKHHVDVEDRADGGVAVAAPEIVVSLGSSGCRFADERVEGFNVGGDGRDGGVVFLGALSLAPAS